jgi:hypothetical protein
MNIDAVPSNADWPKGAWDLIGIDSVESLRQYLERNGETVEHFKTLPVYKANVDKVPWLNDL